MAVRKTKQIGDLSLKAKNLEVKDFKDLKINMVVKDLKDTMKKLQLIGLAAPQIGYNYKIFVTQPRNTKARNLTFKDKLRVYINPKVRKRSKQKNVIWEGCGCVGVTDMFFGPVTRPKEITIEASDENGKKFQIRCDGILSRVIQHEMDHLEGIEFIEKVDDYKKLMHQMHYIEQIKNSESQVENSKVSVFDFKSLS